MTEKDRRDPETQSDADRSDDPLFRIAAELAELQKQVARPGQLEGHPVFAEGVALLGASPYLERLLTYAFGENPLISGMAFVVLAQMNPGADSPPSSGPDPKQVCSSIIEQLRSFDAFRCHFALRALEKWAFEPIIAKVLLSIVGDPSWNNDSTKLAALRTLLARRLEEEESPTFGKNWEPDSADHKAQLKSLTRRFRSFRLPGLDPLLAELSEEPATSTIDLEFVRSVGKVWGPDDVAGVVEHAALTECVEILLAGLTAKTPRSQLILGDAGVGKTSIIRGLADRLMSRGWLVVEGNASGLIAGQRYIGDIELRVLRLVHEIERPARVLWFVPNLAALLLAGRHEHSSVGILDMILPYLERGDLRIVSEAHPTGFERILKEKPNLATVFDVHRVLPAPIEKALEIASESERLRADLEEEGILGPPVLAEAAKLADQFLTHIGSPGHLLSLIELTRNRLALKTPKSESGTGLAIAGSDLYETLSSLSGLPRNIIDDGVKLDLSDLRRHFEGQVLGQPEAIDCLVERVAMIKAGVTDPTRPSGVFFFAGPTGTGKTEMAKTLARYLFGSSDRMIRLDMSEFKTEESLSRLTEGSGAALGQSLVARIREQPFSLILLDEFEKAAAPIWDLFLQLFDDGRLTDSAGLTADFRHTIVIMTSNLGSSVLTGVTVGFQSAGDSPRLSDFRPEEVQQGLRQTFRPEFLNRIDRVIVFRPLSRTIMRRLLENELTWVFERRGLRNRTWAVEWDDSAIEFLLERGFDQNLGARPLKRAVERYLLAPLAVTIVQNSYPEGDQFLFVRSAGKRLAVEFVDPDQIAAPSAHVRETQASTLEEVLLDPRGSRPEFELVSTTLSELIEDGGQRWLAERDEALARLSQSGFWESPDRFRVLGNAEYLDRLHSALDSAVSKQDRIRALLESGQEGIPTSLLQMLAQQVYLLREAKLGLNENQPRYAYVQVDSGEVRPKGDNFGDEIVQMYSNWAKRRGMRLEVVHERASESSQQMIFAVTGFAAFRILESESGNHVFDEPGPGRTPVRQTVSVLVIAQPENEHPPSRPDHRLLWIRSLLKASMVEGRPPETVRRYRRLPSPLVRDLKRGWKTGRLDRVREGDFDVLGSSGRF